MTPHVISAVTCLGCGCTCDDIEVVVTQSRITSTGNACELGRAWFGTGAQSARVRVKGIDASLDMALDEATALLTRASRPRVLLGPDVSCETYGEAVACADALRARVDIVSSASARATTLAIQERGIATATLGEIRNRADVIVFWGVDPAIRFPRFESRVVPGPSGVHIPNGRRSRTVISVDVGHARGPSDADVRVAVAQAAEVDTLIALTAVLSDAPGPEHAIAATLAEHLRKGRYVAIISDDGSEGDVRDGRIHRLLALGHALNRASRGALILLRSGGNLSGAEVVMTRHTGYPGGVDFASGVPQYRPYTEMDLTTHDAALIVGSTARLPTSVVEALAEMPTIVIGPGASEGPCASAAVVIDSATAGIHSGGTAVRMDDVPIPLTQVVPGAPDALFICDGLRRRLQQKGH